MDQQLTWFSAFAAGVVSFLSPCVLPLMPAYFSFLAGTGLTQLQSLENTGLRRRLMAAALFFTLGFSTVFILFGATATLIGRWLNTYAFWLEKAAGLLIVLLGLHLSGIFPLRFLLAEHRMRAKNRQASLAGAYVVGAAFAFGWTPCVGPLLAGMLALAGTRETVGQGIMLLAIYSAGLGLPLLLAAAAVGPFLRWLRRFQPLLRWVELFAGALLLALGLLILTGWMGRVSGWIARLTGGGL